MKAHIFVAALAFLFERMLERALADAGVSLSAKAALEALATVRHAQFRVDGQLRGGVTPGSARARQVLKALQITDHRPRRAKRAARFNVRLALSAGLENARLAKCEHVQFRLCGVSSGIAFLLGQSGIHFSVFRTRNPRFFPRLPDFLVAAVIIPPTSSHTNAENPPAGTRQRHRDSRPYCLSGHQPANGLTKIAGRSRYSSSMLFLRMDSRHAFTLVELVVVILILGILAGVAAPKLLDTSDVATENAQRQTLAVIRDAISRFAANTGSLPGQTKNSDDFKSELAPYVRGGFPTNQFDDNGNKADVVKFRESGDPLVDHVGGDEGWLYDKTTGEFIANSNGVSSDGVTLYSEF